MDSSCIWVSQPTSYSVSWLGRRLKMDPGYRVRIYQPKTGLIILTERKIGRRFRRYCRRSFRIAQKYEQKHQFLVGTKSNPRFRIPRQVRRIHLWLCSRRKGYKRSSLTSHADRQARYGLVRSLSDISRTRTVNPSRRVTRPLLSRPSNLYDTLPFHFCCDEISCDVY